MGADGLCAERSGEILRDGLHRGGAFPFLASGGTRGGAERGEDGATHEPVEQLASLRATPGVAVMRPADATETAALWAAAVARRTGPSALFLSRQNLPVLDRFGDSAPAGVLAEKFGFTEAAVLEAVDEALA